MWVVGEVLRDSQAALDDRTVQHLVSLVSLVSVDDDATWEELQGHLGDRARHSPHGLGVYKGSRCKLCPTSRD